MPLTPDPDNATFCGLPAALSVMLNFAVRVPVAVGLKVTLMLQLAPGVNEVPQLCVSAKSPILTPVSATLLMLKVLVPTLVRLVVLAALVVPKV